jgi:hypothetical protein
VEHKLLITRGKRIQSDVFWRSNAALCSPRDTGDCTEPSAYPCFTRVHPWLRKVEPQIGTDRTPIGDCPGVERLLECGLIARSKTDKGFGLPIPSGQICGPFRRPTRNRRESCQKNNILGNSSTDYAGSPHGISRCPARLRAGPRRVELTRSDHIRIAPRCGFFQPSTVPSARVLRSCRGQSLTNPKRRSARRTESLVQRAQ